MYLGFEKVVNTDFIWFIEKLTNTKSNSNTTIRSQLFEYSNSSNIPDNTYSITNVAQFYSHFQGWTASQENYPNLIIEAERTFDCCGSGINASNSSDIDTKPSLEDHEWSLAHMVFIDGVHKCSGIYTDNSRECFTCYAKLYTMVPFYKIIFISVLSVPFQVQGGFNTAGGLGLFFSIPEVGRVTH